jgi:hypothetical protein
VAGGRQTLWHDFHSLSRPQLAVPLPYEHEENLFLQHSVYREGEVLLRHLLDTLPEEWRITVSDHPLNTLHVDRGALNVFLATASDRLSGAPDDTNAMIAGATAVFTDLSKSWTLAAFAGKPMLHLGQKPMAPWLNAHANIGELTPLIGRRRGVGSNGIWRRVCCGPKRSNSTCCCATPGGADVR